MKKLLLFVMMLTLLAACSNQDEETSNQTETSPSENESEESEETEGDDQPTEQPPEYIYPLTGVATDEEPTNRMMAVMVNNHPKARPQTGLSKADIVFEILAEGNITRFMALFQSELPEKVGPVRSARPYYFHLADDYGAFYVYHGAAEFINNMITGGAVDYISGATWDGDNVHFERSSNRVAPHNSYAIVDGIYEKAEEKGYEIETDYEPLPFTDQAEITGDTASEVKFQYGNNTVRYAYDEANQRYKRFSDGEQTVELADQAPVTMENVLIMETSHQVIDDEGRREIDFESGGDALLLQKGKAQHVQWERMGDKIIPTKDGETVPFVSGKTWINVIPNDPGIEGVNLVGASE
ncbi:hypothetical protein J416_14537 [Gracilibacillus halophilus YIM-C55.5]|uniref:Lipoprotein YerB n=1 Tax=Gracilibacillus halophilus YIM-C55.5 TaxID=1308866 RepID=N4W920_9BACI|nr:DUF3048 domain-containing protein [Gracilibacillus halophilus]ENH95734.1 hypothetical protein J416_14537 [Gracilibacillus halophilus YIM-C55.5]